MSQAIEENTKAVNRLTNTLLSIFNFAAIVNTGANLNQAKPGPDGGAGNPGKTTASAPAATEAGAGTTGAEKAAPAPATKAAEPAPIPMVRESASRLTLHMAASKAEGQGKEAAVALLAEFSDAEGNPVKGAKGLKEEDIPTYLTRLIGILGDATARTVLGVK